MRPNDWNPASRPRPAPAAGAGPSRALLLALALAAMVVLFAHDAPAALAQGGEQQAIEVPGPVTALTLSSTADSVTVHWQAPERGGEPARYIVHLRPEGGETGSGRTKTPRAKKTSVTFDNLEPGATYRVWVRARNAGGKGERTHAAITLPATASVPDSYERPLGVIHCEDYFSKAYCDSF